MKRYLITFIFVIIFMFANAQDSLRVYYQPKYMQYDETYIEFGVGSFIPNDNSNTLVMFDFEIGKYVNEYIGLGLNFKYGQEYEYKDKLGYIGPNIRYRVNYSSRNDLDLNIHGGIGYGWLDYNLYDFYYNNYRTISYVVPNIGLTGYINLNDYMSLGIEPSYFWYISTNKDESKNVGVWNIMGKLKFRF